MVFYTRAELTRKHISVRWDVLAILEKRLPPLRRGRWRAWEAVERDVCDTLNLVHLGGRSLTDARTRRGTFVEIKYVKPVASRRSNDVIVCLVHTSRAQLLELVNNRGFMILVRSDGQMRMIRGSRLRAMLEEV